MGPSPASDTTAIRLAERLIQLLDRGGFTATYKYAVLVSLLDLCMELTSTTGLPPDTITTRQVAEKIIELYWPHCTPYDGERGVLRPLIHRSWALMVADMNGLEEPRLEQFLFGSERTSLDPVRPHLIELQSGQCFYCGKAMSASCHVDHFIPWSRHADNSLHNLVATHEQCNGSKSDHLAAADHVERWRERSASRGAALAEIAREEAWELRPEATLGVARALYGNLPGNVRLWQMPGKFVKVELDGARIAAALAA